MCHLTVDLHLHCSHVTIRPTFCVLSSQFETATGSTGDRATARDHPGSQSSLPQRFRIIDECPKRTRKKTHSYLLCCPTCRGKVEHVEYESPHSDERISVHDTKKICLRSDTKASTLPTCARLKMKSPETPTSTEHGEHSKSAFPYRLGLNDNQRPDQQNSTDATAISSSSQYVTKSTGKFALTSTYLRFPFTNCHHLIPFEMPETCLTEFSENTLPCGCWTGKAPDPQILEAALFIEYFGGETAFNSVWDVTCLGPGGCWECGAREFEVDEGDRAAKGDINHGREKQRLKKQASGVNNIKEAFLEACRQWLKLEDWKDEYYGGDLTERGAKLMAESRF